MDLARLLAYNYVFRGLPREVVAGLASLAHVRHFHGGDVIVRQFEAGRELFVIIEGGARIASLAGETIAEFGPGSIVGEMALIDEGRRSATVTSIGHTVAAAISAETLKGMMDVDPAIRGVIMTNLSRVLCRRLRTMNAQLAPAGPAPAIAGRR